MDNNKFLAIDFGAESGRTIVGTLNRHKIKLEEIHRFPNKIVNIHGSLHWDILYLFEEMILGIKKAVQKGHNDIKSIAVDTWGVDFGFITKDNQLLGNPFAYRDSRTNGMLEEAFKLMPMKEIYKLTGNQFMQINSVFQLLSMIKSKSSLIKYADSVLFMPDLFNYLLTGVKKSEYTIASTSQLLNAKTKKWEEKIFNHLNIPKKIMTDIVMPGNKIGSLHASVINSTGLKNINVIAVGSHDTASAVVAVPKLSNNCAYISSGTWSLIGIETEKPIINKKSLYYNFTNEGGVGGKIRFLRNVMGMWIVQRLKKEWDQEGQLYSYENLNKLAEKATSFKCVIDVDDSSFLNPTSMTDAINKYCEKTNQIIPKTKGEYIRSVLESLAFKYRMIVDIISKLSDRKIEIINIVGGGSQNKLLNQFTADSTGLKVFAGPIEATAFGNIIVQAIAANKIKDIREGREILSKSNSLIEFMPVNKNSWEKEYQKKVNILIG